ncbi:eukaryotic translation initiation factor [Ceraceosorus bombacis]|uniref:Eukaryotic translation initiation factor 3 subunit G n=1 Tax=Ceraceosorus bombacis TaxID=401625 RepID=A0A0P1BT61_9BASI|nr:eukaryotic translation initiation factor [Ceraceosorus bombacis]
MAPVADPAPKPIDWADDGDIDDDAIPPVTPGLPPREERDEGNGVKVIVEYKFNPEGKKVKITRRIRRTLVTTKVNAAEAERKTWAKFGQEKGRKAGPHSSTTTVGENVALKFSAGSTKKDEPEVDEQAALRKQLQSKKITCRLCKGDHFTSKCPYRDTLEAIPGAADTGAEPEVSDAIADPTNPAVAAGTSGAGGKYIPPSMRQGANRGAGERMGGPMNREDMPTLRVTNLSEDADEEDLREIFSRYGRVIRVYIGRDRETGECKGYAFVSFESRDDADKARQKVDGKGYSNLILSVNWSQPRGERPGGA